MSASKQVCAWINACLQKQEDYAERGGEAVVVHYNMTSKPTGVGATFADEINQDIWKNYELAGRNYYVYTEDSYWWDSSGTRTNLGDTQVYVYSD